MPAEIEFEDILEEIKGNRKYQTHLVIFLLIPVTILLPIINMNIIFMASVPDHWCYEPEVANSNLSVAQQKVLIGPPKNSECYMYDENYTEIFTRGNFTIHINSTLKRCDKGWQYDKTDYECTIATEWNLVCDDAYYPSLILTLHNLGSIIGTPILGFLADRFGRKRIFFSSVFLGVATELPSALVRNLTCFIILRTINGSLFPTMFQLPLIITLEIVSPEIRSRINGIVHCCWTFGLCLLTLIAFFTRSWVSLSITTSCIALIPFLYLRYFPESPSWLITNQKYEEALKILKEISEKNGKTNDSANLMPKIKKLGEKCMKNQEIHMKHSALDILKYSKLRKIFTTLSFMWATTYLAYYGLQLNIYNLMGNEFVNFSILSLAEIPGCIICWYMLERFGRRFTLSVNFILMGLSCLLPLAEYPYIDVASSVLGKNFASGIYAAAYQYSSELFPTVIRSSGMGMSNTVGLLATLYTPYIVYLSSFNKNILYITIAFCSFVTCVLILLLPETLNKNLPQTISDAEEFGKDQKFFSFNREMSTKANLNSQSNCISTVESELSEATFPSFTKDLNSKVEKITAKSTDREERNIGRY